MFPIFKKKEEVTKQEVYDLVHQLYNQTPQLSETFKKQLVSAATRLNEDKIKVEDILADLYQPCQAERIALSPKSPALLEELYQLTLKPANKRRFRSSLGAITPASLK